MKTTEKRYWVNGHQVRGGWFHTLNMSLFYYGVMVSWGKTFKVEVFKFV